MTDAFSRTATSYHNEEEKNIIYKPRSGDEMKYAMKNQAPIILYSDLCALAKKFGPSRTLANLFKQYQNAIILLQDPYNMSSGHWTSISYHPDRKEIYFFSSYGGKPDVEKLKWINKADLAASGQNINILNDALRAFQQHGWEIHYNDFHYQKSNDHTAYCGIYTVAFLRSGANPDVFERDTKNLASRGINPTVYYFYKYFR